jgi:glycosyltransferase involved in cell wall biosynthesis
VKEIKFLIIASGYNVEKYVEGCLKSIEAQTYGNFSMLLIDDGSTDKTAENLYDFQPEGSCVIVPFIENKGLVSCRHRALNQRMRGDLYDVIVWLDLDDQLAPNALETLAAAYQDPNCWLTYGGYTDSFGNTYTGRMYPLDPTLPARQQDWKFIPLRSFRRELYEKLTDSDLFPAVAEVYPDASALYCLMELAGADHCRSIDASLYLYNCSNPLNVTKRFPEAQRDAELAFIKSLTPKKPLTKL